MSVVLSNDTRDMCVSSLRRIVLSLWPNKIAAVERSDMDKCIAPEQGYENQK